MYFHNVESENHNVATIIQYVAQNKKGKNSKYCQQHYELRHYEWRRCGCTPSSLAVGITYFDFSEVQFKLIYVIFINLSF